MTDEEIMALFQPLYEDIKPEHQFNHVKPLLAHYTSLEALESIVRNNEIWFSNPLFMNDLEEVRFGVINGANAVRESVAIKNALPEARHASFIQAFDQYFGEFDSNHVLDTYVFSASEHDLGDHDGKLSMWRGYGADGKGVAIIFDTSKMDMNPSVTPLILSRVIYGTQDERSHYLRSVCDKVASILSQHDISDDKIWIVAYAIFDRIKLFALFTKHSAFGEEKEWRAVYRRDLDRDKKYDRMFGYTLGRNGVEPRLKFKIAPLPGITADDFSLEN